jgi:hypothetical protein
MSTRSLLLLVIANILLLGGAQLGNPGRLQADGWPWWNKPCCEVNTEGACTCVYSCWTATCANSTHCTVEKMCGDIE